MTTLIPRTTIFGLITPARTSLGMVVGTMARTSSAPNIMTLLLRVFDQPIASSIPLTSFKGCQISEVV